MEARVKRPQLLKSRVFSALALLSLCSLLGLLLCVLFINSSYGKRRVQEAVHRKTGIHVDYHSCYPKHLDRIRLRHINATKGVSIDLHTLEIDVNLFALIRHQSLRIDHLTLDTPVVECDAELLSKVIRDYLKQVKEQELAIAKNTPQQASETTVSPTIKDHTAPALPLDPLQKRTAKTPPHTKPTVTEKEQTVLTSLPSLTIRQASVAITSKRYPFLNSSAKGLSLDTSKDPYHRKGTFRIKELMLANASIPLNLSQAFKITNGNLILEEKTHSHPLFDAYLSGYFNPSLLGAFNILGKLSFKPNTELSHPLAKDHSLLFGQSHLVFKSKGLLLSPRTISAETRGSVLALSAVHSGSPIYTFDTVSGVVTLQNGLLSAPSLECRSNALNILSNGEGKMNGNSVGIIRLVADSHKKDSITRFLSHSAQPLAPPPFLPLETSDRYVQDILVSTTEFRNAQYRLLPHKEGTTLDRLLHNVSSILSAK